MPSRHATNRNMCVSVASSCRRDVTLASMALASLVPLLPLQAAPVDFNRDIRPILSDKCFRCHGPDEQHRKGGQNGLRLDTLQGATEDLGGGGFAIVPGQPDKSELLARVTATDDDVMPPRKTGKTLSALEIDLLRRWIAGDAAYAKHWAYEKPRRTPPPVVRDTAWPQGEIDRFLLARLEKENLRPQSAADRATLARRVALDLTGLPPSSEEVDAFARDSAPAAYERFVDRQLAKPAYGEHWARSWLDLARYADSKGYADDQPRSIWKYRDYVIDALNRNMPFDQFTIEQLAGDLLPNPTEAQIFATGFHRNTMNNTEGGTDDEEFRVAAVVDRVNTTMAAWMGTSMACAQCHTHKYDPLTQKEYFQLYAIFNQTEDVDRNDEAPVREFYTEAQQVKRTRWEEEIATLEGKLTAAKPAHVAAAESWARDFPTRIAWQFPKPHAAQIKDVYTIEVSVPEDTPVTGLRIEVLPRAPSPAAPANGGEDRFVVTRVRAGTAPGEPFRRARYLRVELSGEDKTVSLAEVEVFAGGENIAGRGSAAQSSTAGEAGAARAIDGRTSGDFTQGSVAQTKADEDNPWWELDLGARAPVERVVIWGRTGAEATPAGLRLILLDEEKQPVWEQTARGAPNPSRVFTVTDPRDLSLTKAVADFAQPDLDASAIITDTKSRTQARRKKEKPPGWDVTGGNAAAPHGLTLQPERPFALKPGEKLVLTIELQAGKTKTPLERFRLGVTFDSRLGEHLLVPSSGLATLRVPTAERNAEQRALLLEYFVQEIAPELALERRKLVALRTSLEDMPIQSSLIMRELPAEKQRKTHVQLRGNFMALGEEVAGGVPAVFPPLPAGVLVNRLTLARWLVAEDNPLTARVVVNRLWEAIFGLGLVRTAEEFGSQGELPSHPELLDWLACELVATKWDMKRFLKLLVTSAAYRQSARVTAEALAADPENRLLARGPRVRLSAEMVRDQALAVSGLLSAKLHGPSVRPYQPAFDLKAAFGGTLDWKPSVGEDRLRRALYTEWRRSSPYPSMMAFDAANREVCTLRRNRSNTPLQALVTLNDPVYVEAAQALARLIAARSDRSLEQRMRDGFHRVLFRPPAVSELEPLFALYRSAFANYAQEPEKAAALLANPEHPSPATIAPADLAAWTVVANVLLNLDETLMKR